MFYRWNGGQITNFDEQISEWSCTIYSIRRISTLKVEQKKFISLGRIFLQMYTSRNMSDASWLCATSLDYLWYNESDFNILSILKLSTKYCRSIAFDYTLILKYNRPYLATFADSDLCSNFMFVLSFLLCRNWDLIASSYTYVRIDINLWIWLHDLQVYYIALGFYLLGLSNLLLPIKFLISGLDWHKAKYISAKPTFWNI
jgi:hypothetical protein